MNKTDFLHKLEERLQMLNASEREDIVSEYSQHIDMKVKDGLSEEQAIKDFGEFDGLIAEILEAYHFNPQFGSESKLQKELSGLASEAKKVSKGAFSWLTAIFRSCGKIAEDILDKSRSLFDALAQKSKPQKAHDKFSKSQNSGKGILSAAGGIFMSFIKITLKILASAFRACVYIGVFFAACMILIPTFCLGLLALFGIGVTAVLLYGGYPIAGIFIGCLGGFLCCASVIAFALSFLIKKGNLPAAEGDRQEKQEAGPKAEI